MSTSTPIVAAKEIERTYMVALIPLTGDPAGREPYEERRVRLRYSIDEAAALDPRSEEAFAEAKARCIRLEHKEFESTRDKGVEYDAKIRLTRDQLVDYLPRKAIRRRRG